jgi:hypothetical protein
MVDLPPPIPDKQPAPAPGPIVNHLRTIEQWIVDPENHVVNIHVGSGWTTSEFLLQFIMGACFGLVVARFFYM